jgi:hypothetical protein
VNNNNLISAAKWLAEMGIKTQARQTNLFINRQDIVDVIGGAEPQRELLEALKEAISSKLFYSVTDDTMGWVVLDSF